MSIGRPVSFWFRFEFIERVDAAAKAEGLNRSQWVIRTIERALLRSKH